MIISELIKIKKTNDNVQIEMAIKDLGIEPLRWAVVGIETDELVICVSYVK